MEIFINDSKLSFQLEKEKNLRQIIDFINDWLFEDNKVIDQIIIDDEIYDGKIEDLSEYKIKDVNELKVTAVNISVLVQSSLLEAKRYLFNIMEIIEDKSKLEKDDINKLITGITWVINVIQRSDNLYKYGEKIESGKFDFIKHLEDIKNSRDFLVTLLNKNDVGDINDFISNNLIKTIEFWENKIDILIDNSIGGFENLKNARVRVSGQIYKIINKIPDILRMIKVISTDLQTGQEKTAMERIQIIISTLESIISLLQLIKTSFNLDYKMISFEDKSVEEYNIELNGILKEIVEAMESDDSVLISDLIEYELSPRLEKYIDVLKLISKEINIEIN